MVDSENKTARLTIRYAVTSDMTTVSNFWCDLMKELNFSVNPKKVQKRLDTLPADKFAHVKLCESDGIPIGTATLYISDRLPERCAWLRRLMTNPNYRRRGVASKLVIDLVQTAINEGCNKIYLECKPELIPFYNKFSFKIDHKTADGYVLCLTFK